jgi:Fic family protein
MEPNKIDNDIEEFLKESNAIEDVHDEDSLQQALYAWNYLKNVKKLSVHDILKTHKILMLHQPGLRPNEKGYLRIVPVYIANHEALNASIIPTTLANLVMNINDIVDHTKNESIIFLERIIKEHHVKYEKIHPFVDGNGRTGRMIMNWERIQVGLPVLIVKANERQIYYKWFK